RARATLDGPPFLFLFLGLAGEHVEQIPHRLVRPVLRVLLDLLLAGGAHRRAHALALAEAAPEILDLLRRHRNHGALPYFCGRPDSSTRTVALGPTPMICTMTSSSLAPSQWILFG